MRGERPGLVDGTVRAALRETVFRFEPVMRINVVAHELLESSCCDRQGDTDPVRDSAREDRAARPLTAAPDPASMSGATWERSMPLHLTYDAKSDIAYLQLRSTGPADVIGPALFLEKDRAFPHLVIADFTLIDGRLVGFELHHASECLPAGLLAAAERIDGQNMARRFGERIARPLDLGIPDPRAKREH
jgi:uncharacterized protein YuzE